MIKLVMFDLDGTLVDTIQDLTNACNYALSSLKYPKRSVSEVMSFVGNGIKNLIKRCLDEDETFLDEAYELFKEYYHLHCLDYSLPYDGIIDLIKYLSEKNIKMAVISNKADQYTKKICQRFFGEYFNLFFGESKEFPKKPCPDGILKVINYFGFDQDECVYIGDSLVDIKTAQAAKIDIISVAYGFRTREQLASSDCIVDTPRDLLECLKNRIHG